MKKIMILAALAAVAIIGCKSIQVEKIERTPVQDGTNGVIIVENVTHGKYYAYGIENNLEGLNIEYSPTSGVKVAINKVSYDMSKQHQLIVKESLDGAATLATKIGEAIATAGGSAGADAVYGYVKQFIAEGGDPSKATVTVTDGNITCTDGSCSESWACPGGNCSE